MLTRVFVTGTDTAVGKTVVSRALLQALSQNGRTAAGYKPVATESKETPEGLRNQDALILQASSSIELDYQEVNPFPLQADVIHACTDTLINYGDMTEGLQRLSTQRAMVVEITQDNSRPGSRVYSPVISHTINAAIIGA